MEEQPFSTLTIGADLNPARVIARGSVARLVIFISFILKNIKFH
jgi:hypothetical protein